MSYKFLNHNVRIETDNSVFDIDTNEFLGYAPEIDGERYLCGKNYKGPLTRV